MARLELRARSPFFAMVDMEIGPANGEGGETFGLMVCTPHWFEDNIMTKRPSDPTHEKVRKTVFGRHYLFVHACDEVEIEKEIRLIVDRVKGKDWRDLALRLSRFFSWEFEDYNKDSGIPKSF